MVNEIETIYILWLNKGFSSRFCAISCVRHNRPEEERISRNFVKKWRRGQLSEYSRWWNLSGYYIILFKPRVWNISSSSCRAGSTDIPEPLSPLFPIFHRPGRSSGQHPVSSHSCWMYVRAGRPAFARPCVGVHKSTSLLSSSLLLQQCPACLVRLTWIVFVIGGRWPYSWCLVGCCCQDLFKIARSILV